MSINKEQWSSVDRGLSGDKNKFKHRKDFDSNNLPAMGLIRSIEAIPDFIKSLSKDSTAKDASPALNLITSAGLYESKKSPDNVRKPAYEELVIRYNIDFSFETEMLIQNQISVIKKYENGKWYFHGELI